MVARQGCFIGCESCTRLMPQGGNQINRPPQGCTPTEPEHAPEPAPKPPPILERVEAAPAPAPAPGRSWWPGSWWGSNKRARTDDTDDE